MYALPVYHVDTAERVDEYLNNNKFLSSNEDGDWLGAGMYFWDNQANSRYWYAIKTRNNPTNSYCTVKVQQNFDDNELLDLTDKDILSRTLQYAKVLEGMRNTSKDVRKHIGALLNALFLATNSSPELFNFTFSVIKGVGLYKKEELKYNDDGIIDTTLSKSPHLTHYMKTIYLFKHDQYAVKSSKEKVDIGL